MKDKVLVITKKLINAKPKILKTVVLKKLELTFKKYKFTTPAK